MYVEVVATLSSQARLGERFTLRTTPLRVGASRTARIRVGDSGGDLELSLLDGAPQVQAAAQAPRASVNGLPLEPGKARPLHDGDCLYVHPGLALMVRAQAPVVVREPALEATLARQDDEGSWQVYRDLLEERGDRLSEWLRHAAHATAPERLAQLGPLADAVALGLVEVAWSPRGTVEGAWFSRQAVVGAPGAFWLLAQLSCLPVARFLRRLRVALFAGAAGHDADLEGARFVDAVAGAPFAVALRELTLGFVSLPRQWAATHAALERLRAVAPALATTASDLIRPGGQASVHVTRLPRGVDVVATDVVLNPGRSDVGTHNACHVRLVGDAPQVACTFHRQSDGQWVVFDELADPFRVADSRHALRVNGVPTVRAALAPGDLVEPVEGLTLRFDLG